MTVQSNRANLLEAQLKDQMASVQAKNEQVARLNSLLVAANKISAKLPAGAKAADALPGGAEKADFDARAKAAGYSFASATKGDLDAAIQNIKSSIDAASNSQQMDMLRLQSLSNKRNEAFETMTNFIKKMQESRSSIIGNMR